MSTPQPESSAPTPDGIAAASADLDPQFEQALQRLHQLVLWGRWGVVGVLWLSVAPLSLYALRSEMVLWLDHFTWSALRYGLAFNPVPTLGLALCLASLLSALLWQSQHALVGISNRERQRLLRRVQRIHQQGPSHPLWRWTFGKAEGTIAQRLHRRIEGQGEDTTVRAASPQENSQSDRPSARS